MLDYVNMPDISNELFIKDFDAFKGMENIKIPPNCTLEFQGKTVEYVPRKKIVRVFGVPEKFTNPIGVLQGGVLTAFFDDTIGPLSFAVAKAPIVTTSLTINFVRSVAPGDSLIIIAEVVTRSPLTIFFEAKAYDQKHKLVASLSSQNLILKK